MGNNWYDILAIIAAAGAGILILVLGWRRTPLLIQPRQVQTRGLKGVAERLQANIQARLVARVGGELPEGASSINFVLVILGAISISLLVFLWMGLGPLSLLFGAVAGYIAATVYASWAAKKRAVELDDQVMACLEIMRLVQRASKAQALVVLKDAIVELGNPVQEEIGDIISLTATSERIDVVLRHLQDRAAGRSERLRELIALLADIYRPTEDGRVDPERQAQMVDVSYEVAQDQDEVDRKVDEMSTQPKATRWVVVAIIVGVLLYEFLVQGDTMRYFISTTMGMISLGIVALLILGVIFIGERLAKVE